MQSYTDFLQSTLTDRDTQSAYLDNMWKGSDTATADARLSGLTREEAASVLADVTGMPQFKRFAENRVQRGFDAFGSFVHGMFTNTKPADFTDWGGKAVAGITGNDYIDPVDNTRSQKSFGESGGDFGEATAKFFGATDPSTLAGSRAAGEMLPGTIGMLGTMIGLGPAGVGLGLGSMYGSGIGQAYDRGVMGAKATGVGAIAPAIMIGTMGLAKPLASWAGGKLAGASATEAVAATGAKYPGSVALAEAIGSTATSYPKKVGLKFAQEAVAQSAFSAGNIAGNIGTQIVLDKDAFFSTSIKSQEYWIPTLVNEVINGVGGSTIGRLHNPIKTNATLARENAARVTSQQAADRGQARLDAVNAVQEQARNPLVSDPVPVESQDASLVVPPVPDAVNDINSTPAAPKVEAPLGDLPPPPESMTREGTLWEPAERIFPDEEVVVRGQDPSSESADLDVISHEQGIRRENVTQEMDLMQESVKAKAVRDEETGEVVLQESEAPLAVQPEIAEVAAGNRAVVEGRVAPGQNAASVGVNSIHAEVELSHPDVPVENVLAQGHGKNMGENKYHVIKTTQVGEHRNEVRILNAPTAVDNVTLQIHRVDDAGVMRPVKRESGEGNAWVKLTTQRLLDMLDPTKRSRESIDREAGTKLTDEEYAALLAMGTAVQKQMGEVPVVLSWAKGSEASPEYRAHIQNFFDSLGLTEYLVANGKKVRFGGKSSGFEQADVLENALDYFGSRNDARNVYVNGEMHYISQYDGVMPKSDAHVFDLEEIGHTIHRSIEEGAFGPEAAAELEGVLAKLTEGGLAKREFGDARVGVKLKMDLKQAIASEQGGEAGNLLQRVSPDDFAVMGEYLRRREEMVASTFQGLMLEQAGDARAGAKYSGWVKESFPKLFELFSKIVKAWRRDKDKNLYSPGYAEVKSVLKGILDGAYNRKRSISKEIVDGLAKRNIETDTNIAQAFSWMLLQHSDPAVRNALWRKLDGMNDGFGYVDSDGTIAGLMASHRTMKIVGPVADGATPREETISKLPGIAWLQHVSYKQMERLSKYFGDRASDPVERARLLEVFGTEETFGYVAQLSKDVNAYKDAIAASDGDALNVEAMEKARSFVSSMSRWAEHAQSALVKMGEMMSVRDPMDRHALGATKYPSEVKGEWQPNVMYEEGYLHAINKVARDWTLGRLEGQDGMPMHDPVGKMKGKKPDAEGLDTLFPILHKALQKEFRAVEKELGMAKEHEGYVKTDGSFALGEKSEVRGRMVFADVEEARAYIAEVKKNSTTAMVRMMPRVEGDKVFVRVKGNRDGLNAETLTGTHNELVARPDNFRDLQPRERVLAEATVAKARSEVIRELTERGGPSVMRRLSDVVPKIFGRITASVDQGQGFDAWAGKVKGFIAWREESKANADAYKYIARQLGMDDNVSPRDLATKYVELRMKSFDYWSKQPGRNIEAAKAMELSDLKWAGMAAPEIKSFIESAYSVAWDISRQEIVRSRQQNDGAVPLVDPGQQGLEAGLHNTNVMADENVLAGTIAAGRVVPGSQVGAPPTYAGDTGFIKRAFGNSFGVINSIHAWYGQGAAMRALYKKGWEWAGLRLSQETGQASAAATANLEPLSGYIDKSGPAWKIVERKGNDPKNAFAKLQTNSTEWQRMNDIKRLENMAEKSFDDILASKPTTPEEVAAKMEAERLRQGMTAEWAAVHEEALWRFKEANGRKVENIIRKQPEITITETAKMFIQNPKFEGRASDAEAIATRFYDEPDQTLKLKILVDEAKYSPETAQHVLDAYNTKEKFLTEVHAMLREQASWHVSEKRHEPFQVDYVLKKAPGEKHARRGTHGFQTAAEAEAFVSQMKAKGHSVSRGIIKIKENSAKYKPTSEGLNDIIQRKTAETTNIVTALIAGDMAPDQVQSVIDTIMALPTDITLANEANTLKAQLKGKNKLIEGREQLDMLNQLIYSGKSIPAAMERRHTDMKFDLYERDHEMLKDPGTFKVMSEFKKGIRYKDTEAQRQIGQAGFIMTMALSPATGMVEAFQAPITMAPAMLEASTNGLGLMQSQKMLAGLFKHAFKASSSRLSTKSDAGVWSPIHENFIQEAVRQNRMNQYRYHDIETNQSMEYLQKFTAQTAEPGVVTNAKGAAHWFFTHINNFYGHFNRFNAEISGISAFEVHMDNRFPGWLKMKYDNPQRQKLIDSLPHQEFKEIMDKAILTSEVANGALQRLGRPGRFNTQMPGDRAKASAFWSLQSYVNASIANQLRWFKKYFNASGEYTKAESIQARKALTMMYGMQFLAMGISGFTLFPAINKLVTMATGFDMEEETRKYFYDPDGATEEDKVFWGELFMNGTANALGSPIDYGTRLGIAGMGPFSAYSGIEPRQLGGPLMGLTVQAFRDINKIRAGEMGASEFGLNLLPVGMRRAIRTEYFNDGQVLDGNKKFMFQPSTAERWTMALGFNTSRARKEMQARMQQTEGKLADTARRTQWSNEVMQAMSERNVANVQALLDQGQTEFGEDKRSLARYVSDRATEKVFGQKFSEGTGPKAQIASALYPRQMEKATNVARALHTQAYMQNLGVRPNVSRTAIRRAYGLDSLLTQNPGLSTGVARDMLSGKPRGFTVFDTIREGPQVAIPGSQFGLGQ